MGKLYIGNTVINTISKLKVGSSSVQKIYVGSTLIFPSSIIFPSGSKDTSFNIGTGFNNTVYSVKMDSSEKIYVGGFFGSYSGSSQNGLIRLNSDGTKDTSFNIGTGFTGGSIVYSISQESGGKIYAGGVFTAYSGSSQEGLVKINTDGTKDTSFNIGTGFSAGEIYATEIDSNGKLLVGGLFLNYSGSSQNSLIRLNSDGTKDTSFNIGTGFDAQVYELKIDSNGKILVGGNFTTYSGSSQTRLIRLNSDGTKDTSFNVGAGCDLGVKLITIDSSEKIYVGGFFSSYSGSSQNGLVRLNTDGTKDTSFNVGTGFNSGVESLIIDASGSLIVGGSFTSYSGSGQNGLVKLNTNGTKDTTFDIGTGFDAGVQSLVTQSDGKIVAGGSFTTYKGSSQNRLIRLT
jgi:uncharacterized delta-60 repeat protein